MNRIEKLNVTISIMLVAGLLMTGCSNFSLNLPFFSSYKVPDNPPRAKFLQKRYLPVKNYKSVVIKAPLKQTLDIVEDAITSTVDTTTYRLEIPADTSKNAPEKIKIRSNTIQVKDISKIDEYFYTGDYIITDPNLEVRPQNAQYYVEVKIIGGLHGHVIEPRMYASVNWELYKYRPKKGDTLKVPSEVEPYYGIGSYVFKVEETYLNYKNKEKSFTYWDEEIIDDNPISKGILEADLRNKLIEYAALRNISASVNSR